MKIKGVSGTLGRGEHYENFHPVVAFHGYEIVVVHPMLIPTNYTDKSGMESMLNDDRMSIELGIQEQKSNARLMAYSGPRENTLKKVDGIEYYSGFAGKNEISISIEDSAFICNKPDLNYVQAVYNKVSGDK
ncbi:TPA: hypothetical protein JEO25_000476 [Salmonella enterica subsp. enterica serovar Wangata]|jgi:hypothetical protein|nr:hypothetical protein [Salmonella enterica subsp. enterica serovar Wangata]HAU7790767.1 hypothetical protein [Salmonella enterica subsp. enterica serovar Wangata]HAU7803446.1 hypothetical protein [Salmonella enterica subsp. enterica serovar Wangata]